MSPISKWVAFFKRDKACVCEQQEAFVDAHLSAHEKKGTQSKVRRGRQFQSPVNGLICFSAIIIQFVAAKPTRSGGQF